MATIKNDRDVALQSRGVNSRIMNPSVSVSVTSTTPSNLPYFTYADNSLTVLTPASITLTASAMGAGSYTAPAYAWYYSTQMDPTTWIALSSTTAALTITASAFSTQLSTGLNVNYKVMVSQYGWTTTSVITGINGYKNINSVPVVSISRENIVLSATGSSVDYSNSTTDIIVSINGINIPYDSTNTIANSFTVVATPSVSPSIVVGTASTITTITANDTRHFDVASGLSSLTSSASIIFNITVRDIRGKVYTYNKIQNIMAGIAGQTAKTLTLSSDSLIFSRDATNAITTPAYIKLTANKQNTTGNVTWNTNPAVNLYTTSTGGTSTTLGDVVYLRSADYGTNTYVNITANIAADSLTDTTSISSVKAGSYALQAVLSNVTSPLPTSSVGVVTYTGSGTTIQVYEGSVLRTITAVNITTSNINSGTVSGLNTTTVTIGDHNTATANNGYVKYALTITRGDGTSDSSISVTQSIFKSIQGANGSAGSPGSAGTSVYTATVYQQVATQPATPVATSSSYNFSNGLLTPPTGWLSAQPATTSVPTYACDYTFIGTAGSTVTGINSWSTPYIEAVSGTSGTSTFIMQLFSTSTGTAITSGTIGYDFSRGVIVNVPTGWQTTMPATGSTATYLTTATVSSQDPKATVTVTAASWSTPVAIAQNGVGGSPGISTFTVEVYSNTGTTAVPSVPTSGTTNYNITTGQFTGTGISSWGLVMPTSNTFPTYMTTAVVSTTTPGTAVGITAWTAPVIAAQLSTNGISIYTLQVFNNTSNSTITTDLVNVKYNFSTGLITNLPSMWSVTMPPTGNAATFMTSVLLSTSTPNSDITISQASWTKPVAVAQNGQGGTAGNSLFTVEAYLVGVTGTTPATPTSNSSTYNISTGILSTGTAAGAVSTSGTWVLSMPTTTSNPTYMITAVVSTADPLTAVPIATWSTPVVAAQNGINGEYRDIIELYLIATSKPTKPTSASYLFTTNGVLASNSISTIVGGSTGWSMDKPTATTTEMYVTTCLANTATPTIPVTLTNWTDPVVIAKLATDGTSVYTATVYQQVTTKPTKPTATNSSYNFSTGVLTPPTGWSFTQPATSTIPTYACDYTFIGTAGSTVTGIGSWSETYIEAVSGTSGTSTYTMQLFSTGTGTPISITTIGYDFSRGIIVNVPTGWQTTMPATGSTSTYLTTATVSTQDPTATVTAPSWSTPVAIAQNGVGGTPGNSIFTVEVYSNTSSNTVPSVPTSGTTSYNISTGQFTGTGVGSWSTTLISNTFPTYMATAVVSTPTPGTAVGITAWTAPVIVSQLSTNGVSVYTIQLFNNTSDASATSTLTAAKYNFSTGKVTGISTTNWTTTQPSTTSLPTYMTSVLVSTSTPGTDITIAQTSWGTPVIVAQLGVGGTPGSSVFTVEAYLVGVTGTTPATPTSNSSTYNISTGILSTGTAIGAVSTSGTWTLSMPTTTSNPTYMTTAVVSTTTPGTAVAIPAWSAPVIAAQNGTNGEYRDIIELYQQVAITPTQPTSVQYTFSPTSTVGIVTGGTGTWSPTVPSSSTTPTYITKCLANTTTPTITLNLTNWSAPVIYSQNGTNGAAGATLKSVYAYAFIWATSAPTITSTASTYTWATSALSVYPSGWSASSAAPPGTGYTLYQLSLRITTTSSTATTTTVDWINGTINVIGYRNDGSIGLTGNASRTAYIVTTSSTAPSVVTAGSGDVAPINTVTGQVSAWSYIATSNLQPGQYMYQVDGSYTNGGGVIWNNPYLSNLKVGSLSAIAADLGTVSISTTGSLSTTGKTYGNTTDGVFLGYSGAAYKFELGASNSTGMSWDGATFTIRGAGGTPILTSGNIAADILNSAVTPALIGAATVASLANKLDAAGASILTGPVSLNSANAILVGNTTDGLYLGNTGIVGVKAGAVSFSVDNLGNANFAGTLNAAKGTFTGSLTAATGTFSGSLTADAVNAVNTINIGNNAVTVPVGAVFTNNINIPISGATVTLGSVIINTLGNPMYISVQGTAGPNAYGNGTETITLYVNGTAVRSTVASWYYGPADRSIGSPYIITYGTISMSWYGTIPTGNITVSLTGSADNDSLANVTIFCLGVKK